VLTKLLLALSVMALCVIVHASGITWALRHLRSGPLQRQRLWHVTGAYIALAAWMIVCHLVEVAAWALLYVLGGAMTDIQSALYFSAVTYTTTGYGDLVLPQEWRLVGAVEALTGILMCGWSTAFFFAVLARLSAVTPDAGS
jgi:hypothetical protein